MLDGYTLQAWSTEVLELAQGIASYPNDLNNRTRVTQCKNASESNIVFEW